MQDEAVAGHADEDDDNASRVVVGRRSAGVADDDILHGGDDVEVHVDEEMIHVEGDVLDEGGYYYM